MIMAFRCIAGQTKHFSALVPLLLLVWLLSVADCLAGLGSQKCSECHTMHRSQDNRVLSEWGTGGPQAALLITDCAGCHTGTNTPGSMPYVLSSVEPLYGQTGTEANTNTLAGGSFHWVSRALGDRKGHNIVGVAAADATLQTPPGFDGSTTAIDNSSPGGGNWPAGTQVTCAGTYGCHGTHAETIETKAIRGGHHLGMDGAITVASSEPAEGYRMLLGITGYEDPEWELTPTISAHNQYKGVDQATDKTTISALCARCHGDFHRQTGLDVWTMHPVDYDMANLGAGTEYRQYGGATNLYQVAVPVASTQVTNPLTNVMQGGDSIITCVSCHRAHGSPNDKLLRWDYTGSSGAGCVYCHTSKS
jgi:predicted CXXCH cytochrome family protein